VQNGEICKGSEAIDAANSTITMFKAVPEETGISFLLHAKYLSKNIIIFSDSHALR
jgi:hypothetical protein